MNEVAGEKTTDDRCRHVLRLMRLRLSVVIAKAAVAAVAAVPAAAASTAVAAVPATAAATAVYVGARGAFVVLKATAVGSSVVIRGASLAEATAARTVVVAA